jgi:hypothetical protein
MILCEKACRHKQGPLGPHEPSRDWKLCGRVRGVIGVGCVDDEIAQPIRHVPYFLQAKITRQSWVTLACSCFICLLPLSVPAVLWCPLNTGNNLTPNDINVPQWLKHETGNGGSRPPSITPVYLKRLSSTIVSSWPANLGSTWSRSRRQHIQSVGPRAARRVLPLALPLKPQLIKECPLALRSRRLPAERHAGRRAETQGACSRWERRKTVVMCK